MSDKTSEEKTPSLSGVVSKDVYDRYKNEKTSRNYKTIAMTCVIVFLVVVSVGVLGFLVKDLFFPGDEDNEAPFTCKTGDEIVTRYSDQLEVEIITRELSEFYNVPMGVKITWVNSEGAFSNADFRVNDIIVKIGKNQVRTLEDISKYESVEKEREDALYIDYTVYRNGEYLTLEIAK